MSMQHKAFLFDYVKYCDEIKNVLKNCCECNNISMAAKYIELNYYKLKSPYTGIRLTKKWKEEFCLDSLQEYFDFILTACYDPGDDMGLDYGWDSLLVFLENTKLIENARKCILGNEIIFNDIKIDPGAMGLGIISSDEVIEIATYLKDYSNIVFKIDKSFEILYDFSEIELKVYFMDLINIYNKAQQKKRGLLMTF